MSLEAPIPTETLTLASRWRRLGAAMIDNIVIIVLATPIIMDFGLIDEIVETAGQPSTATAKVAAVLYSVWLAVNAWPLQKRAQSLGKMALGVMIVDDRGHPAPLLRVAVDRTLSIQVMALIPYIGSAIATVDVLLIFRRDRRCMHDLIARTHVVDRSSHPAAHDPATRMPVTSTTEWAR